MKLSMLKLQECILFSGMEHQVDYIVSHDVNDCSRMGEG